MFEFLFWLFQKEPKTKTDIPMFLLVWLWNPWTQYVNTRHNAGFLVVDRLAEEWSADEWKLHRESNSLMCSCRWEGEKALLIKPQSYMNRSWWAIRYRSTFYKIDINNILVIHDDIDLTPQRLKLKKWWSSGGQNGINDTIQKLWTKDFWRLKCWIWRPLNPKFEIKDYVLWKMSWEELHFWEDEGKRFVEKVEEWRRNRE
jgi:PTH1 family peptidyl-tRNA hydrolase